MLIGQKTREKFLASKSSRILFLITSIFSVAPDFDYLVKLVLEYLGTNLGITSLFNHRGLTHSIFIPFVLVIIGLILTGIASKKYDQTSVNSKSINLRLIGYCFIIASVFWGFHILLDLDAGEGPILLFWPFDDRTYTVTLLLELFAYPFFLLPWTPVGYDVYVQHSGIQALQAYLLNWTPQQIINTYGSPYFYLSFSGLILHTMIFLVYIHYVLRPIFHDAGFEVPKRFKNLTASILRMFSSIKGYWNKTPQWLIAVAFILTLIGYAFGPMLGTLATESQQTQGTLFVGSNSFSPAAFISFGTVSQPLDPQAVQTLQFSVYNVTTPNLTLSFVVVPANLFDQWLTSINSLFQTQNSSREANILANATFKSNYETDTHQFLIHPGIVFSKTNVTTTFSPPNITLRGKQDISAGFIINSWNNFSSFSNISSINSFVNFSLELIYTRDINFLLGVIIEISGLFILVMAVTYPVTKQKLIHFLK